ncbi:MAG TPA: iron-sulfur cluster assembly accessory protein [Nitrospira sp.]|nr:iron-sulfur cluster assembly accessory protein [Nitrospira sp.]
MITMTAIAEQKIRELMQEEQDTIGLRVYVKGGGCHGYQYGMAFESRVAEDDTVIEKGIKNPQAKTACGCGSSFSA